MLRENIATLMHAVRFEGSLIYMHISAVFRTGGEADSLTQASLELGLEPFRLNARDLDQLATLCNEPSSRTIVFVEKLHDLLLIEGASDLLGRARPVVSGLRECGARIVLVSTVPVSRFPTTLGSPILLDAHEVYPKRGTDSEIREFLSSYQLDSTDLDNVVRFSSGSPALAQKFADIASQEDSGRSKVRRINLAESSLALVCMEELGTELCAELEYYAYECGINICGVEEIPSSLLQVLKQSGLARLSALPSQVEVLPFENRDTWLSASNRALQRVVEAPPGWRTVAEGLFAIERMIRLALYEFASERLLEGWLSSLDMFAPGIVGLASQDTALEIRSLADVRQPLDWLTYDALIDYGKNCTLSGLTTAISAADWERLRSETVPIRNRLAHMRLPRQADKSVVMRWRNSLELRWSGMLFRPESIGQRYSEPNSLPTRPDQLL